ncbi:MAG: sigma-70 family RNA polymerase sigma factor [Pirellulaceae bacterium]|nr:sigma-70 family RNA polymerase sigma factor [Pirellulaceae bacterium]
MSGTNKTDATSATHDTQRLVELAAGGDEAALGQLLVQYRERLLRVVGFRMDGRLRGRIDPADVVQEAYLEAAGRFAEYVRDPRMPFFLWLRFLTVQKLLQLHRHHLGYKMRDASREVSLYNGPLPEATSAVLAAQLLGRQTTPSQAAVRAEVKLRLEQALNEMEATDREVLALRHFEHLTNVETAKVLGLTESAASNRYVRAVKRLKRILDDPA